MSSTVKRIILYAPMSLLFIAFCVGTFWDLDIARVLGSHKNDFSLIIACFMPLLAYGGLAALAGMAYRLGLEFENKVIRIIFYVVAAGTLAVSSFMGYNEMIGPDALNLEGRNQALICLIISILIMCSLAFFGYVLADKNTDEKPDLWLTVLFMIALAAIMIGGCFVLKHIFHRLRFSYIQNGVSGFNYNDFNMWFMKSSAYKDFQNVEAMKDAFESFPSGHTGSLSLLIFYLPFFFSLIPRLKEYTWAGFAAGIVLTLLTAFSRMLAGSHYLADCMASILIVYIPFLIGYELFFAKMDQAKQQ